MKRTAEEKKEYKSKLRDIAKKISQMNDSEKHALIGNGILTAEGKYLSVYNSCFVMIQYPQASQVGGFKQWKKAGRTVSKGQRACACIWIPTNKKSEPNEESEESEVRFITIPVFDISQTEELLESKAA